MRLIDTANIDFVILEDSLHRIEHKKDDEIDCIIGAETVQAIPLDKVKQDREEIDDLYRYYDNDPCSGNNDSMFKCNEVLEILDKLIESEGVND